MKNPEKCRKITKKPDFLQPGKGFSVKLTKNERFFPIGTFSL